MADTCRIALLGQKFMGRVHSSAYSHVAQFFNVPIRPVMHTVVGQDLIALAPFADKWGWKNYGTAWKDVVKQNDIDLVDISTPNYMHAEQALAALSNGKHVACERPLAITLKDARQIKNLASRSRKCKTFVWYNYRRCPAVALARELVTTGRLGRVYHLRARYLQDWGRPEAPLSWRFQKKYAGSGAHGDLNAHIVDLARFVTGEDFVEIAGAVAETFIEHREMVQAAKRPSRSRSSSSRKSSAARRKTQGPVDVDDALLFLARMGGGIVSSFEATRLATGHANEPAFEIHGERGALRFTLEDMNALMYYDNDDDSATSGWKRIPCTRAGDHAYAGAWWPEGHPLGYENTFTNMVADMMAVLAGDEPILPTPDFADAYETQRVLEAAALAAKNRAAVKLSEIK